MTDTVGVGRGRSWISSAATVLAPGVPQILSGRIGAGFYALTMWLGLIVLTVFRWDRVAASPTGPLDHQIAGLALVLVFVGILVWSIRSGGEAASPRHGGLWSTALVSFRRNRLAVFGLSVIGVLYLLALWTPFIAPFDPAAQGDLIEERFLTPFTRAHPLGTDRFARDVFTRLLYGARISLSIGFIAVGISVTIGTLLGAVSGYLGGWVDGAIMRFVDMVISFPRLILLITIIAVLEPSIFLTTVVLGLTQWPGTTRIVRAEVLSLREREFVIAARALGYSAPRIIFGHVIPNVMAPVIVAGTLGIGNTIVLEAGLSYLGLGVQPPTASWGMMVAVGRQSLLDAWWIATFPGLAIVLTVLCFNLVGDGLRDALDPRLRS